MQLHPKSSPPDWLSKIPHRNLVATTVEMVSLTRGLVRSWGSHGLLHAMMNFGLGQASAPREQWLTSEKDLCSVQHIWMPGIGRDHARHMLGHVHTYRPTRGEPGPRMLEARDCFCMLNMMKQSWLPIRCTADCMRFGPKLALQTTLW